jgi:hypothetical protein
MQYAEKMRNAYKILVGKPGRKRLRDLGIHKKITLRPILRKI